MMTCLKIESSKSFRDKKVKHSAHDGADMEINVAKNIQ